MWSVVERWKQYSLGCTALILLVVPLVTFSMGGESSPLKVPPVPQDYRATPAKTADGDLRLKVMALNAFLRPMPASWADENDCRANRIGERLATDAESADIAVLTESFDTPDMKELAEKARKRFPYQSLSLPVKKNVLKIDGGLSIFSRFPIEKIKTERYERCNGTLGDCLASKGILHALVRVTEKLKVNVVATHMDSGTGAKDREVRKTQLDHLRRYLDEQVEIEEWPTLLVGDMNIDGLRSKIDRVNGRLAEYGEMLSTLGNSCATCQTDACRQDCNSFPLDAVREKFRSWRFDEEQTRPLNTLNCSGISVSPCDSPNDPENWNHRKRIDYILYYAPKLAKRIEANVVEAFHQPLEDDTCDTRYLSDHQAVTAVIDFATPQEITKTARR